MRRFLDDATDDHQTDEDKAAVSWSVALTDDCEGCQDPRVVLTVEPVGGHGQGQVAHLTPATARRLRAALAAGLRELGEAVDTD